ncbi:MAG: C4-type zinc ribbon domain-containing protein [Desulfobulbaceae bacterium]|nr:C4-type zinc ribbon domain-containing protein [Desulfobulbaceae bacterium]
MNKHIAQLVQLQGLDLELDKIDNGIRAEQEALAERVQSIADREEAVKELAAAIKEKEKEKKLLEDTMADKQDQVRDRQSKMMRVQTSREQQAILREIEEAKKLVKEHEDHILAIMQEVEKMQARIAEEKNLIAGETTLAAEESKRVRRTVEEITTAKKTKQARRNQEAAQIDAALLRKYEMLRQRRHGIAITNVDQEVCQGCHMKLPPQQYNLLLRGDSIHECPSCQRIVYYRSQQGA